MSRQGSKVKPAFADQEGLIVVRRAPGRAPIPTKKEVTGCSPSRCAYTVTIERNGFVTDPSAEPKGGHQSVELEAAPEEP